MKKVISILIVVMLLFSLNAGVLHSYATSASTDIIITNHNGLSQSIREGREFDLSFTLENRSGSNLKDIYIEIQENDSFTPVGYGSRILFSDGALTAGASKSSSIKFKYVGGNSSRIPIKIIYKKLNAGPDSWSGELSTVEYIGVNAIPEVPTPEPQPEDTSKYIPVLNVSDSSRTSIEAGENRSISFAVKNNSEFVAENIAIRPHISSDTPFTIENLNASQFISRIRPNGTSSFSLKVNADITAREKSYPITLSYQFYNGHGDLFKSEETIYLSVINKSSSPKLNIESVNLPVQDIMPGNVINVGFLIKNNGTLDAKDVNISIDGLSNNGISITNMTNQKYHAVLGGNKYVYVDYNLKVSDKIESGTQHLDLKIKYKDPSGASYEESNQFFINVKEKAVKLSDLSIGNIVVPNYDIGVGEDFKVRFNLTNNGLGEAKNVKVLLGMDEEIIPKSPSIVNIQSIKAGDTKALEFTLSSTDKAITRNYPISITVEYENTDNKNGKQTLNQYLGVFIENIDDSNNSVPKIIIDQYNFTPSIVRAGENFDLRVSFLNTNRSKAIQNIKIFLTVDEETEKSGNVFTPVNSSNTFYIDYISPKDRVEKNITMFTVPDASPKTYTIKANFEYEDLDGNKLEATELIGIPVIQQSRLETSEINIPSEVFIGEPVYVSLEFYNMGKVTLNNLMVKVEGNFTVENPNYFVGNFDAGNSEFYEATIIPTEPGLATGRVVFSYEDSNGEIIEIEKDISFNVMEMAVDPFPPGFEDMEPGMEDQGIVKKIFTNKIFWFILVTALAVAAFIIIKKRAIKKKGMSLDE